jgi:hypothetical protein
MLELLPKIQLARLGNDEPAGLWLCSLPWPRETARNLSIARRPTGQHQIGQWPRTAFAAPRRLMLAADGENSAPKFLKLHGGSSYDNAGPVLGSELFESVRDPAFVCERLLLRLRSKTRSIGIALGLRVNGAIHWWEACRLVVLSKDSACTVVEMGGAIPVDRYGIEAILAKPGVDNPYLHKHNWVYGKTYVRAHTNGVCEIFAHHINSKYVDDGADFQHTVPIIGLFSDNVVNEKFSSTWTGKRTEFEFSGVRLDVRDVSRLATEAQPGKLEKDGGVLIWQPYEGMELFGGKAAFDRTGDAYIYRSAAQRLPRGMARTMRFSLSLSDRSPVVKRYLAPDWWYGLCEELVPDALLPVKNEYDEKISRANIWMKTHMHAGGFEDGCVARSGNDSGIPSLPRRYEPGWEGDIPYAQFLTAWMSADAEDYECALRAAYYFTDVAIDHSAKLVRMHGWPPVAFSLPMNRVTGTIAAYLETGDSYLLETACAVVDNAHSLHRNAWPRLTVGRDACFIRGAAMLYRYFGDEHYRKIAVAGVSSLREAQLPDGSFADQGGGTGIHQRYSYVVKPWMCTLAASAALDCAELFPEEDWIADVVIRLADWLLREHRAYKRWSYQHCFAGTRKHFNLQHRKWADLPGLGDFHQESLARIMGFASLRSGNAAYLQAWQKSYADHPSAYFDHAASAAMQYLPWLKARLWQPRLENGVLTLTAIHFGEHTPRAATVCTPDGPVHIAWKNKSEVLAPEQTRVHIQHLHANAEEPQVIK